MSAVPFFASRCCWILPSGPLNKAHALIRLSTSPCVAALSSKQFLLLLFSLRSICVRSDGMCRHVRARRLSNHPYRGEVVGGRSAVQLPEPPHATDSLCLSCHHIERQLPPNYHHLTYTPPPPRPLCARDSRKRDGWRAAWTWCVVTVPRWCYGKKNAHKWIF